MQPKRKPKLSEAEGWVSPINVIISFCTLHCTQAVYSAKAQRQQAKLQSKVKKSKENTQNQNQHKKIKNGKGSLKKINSIL